MNSFRLEVESGGNTYRASGVLFDPEWDIRIFPWEKDPREHPDAWKALLESGDFVVQYIQSSLSFHWKDEPVHSDIGSDRFGTLATTRIRTPRGRYELRTLSDDGIRVWIDDTLVVDDWTHHGPTRHDAEILLSSGRHDVRVEHFELDGWAVLEVSLVPK